MVCARLLIIIGFLLLAVNATGLGQGLNDTPEAVSEFARGERLLREGNYLDASRLFMQLAGRFPHSPNLDLFIFNRAKADYYFGNHSDAIAGFGEFIRRFPRSDYLAHAYFFQANSNYLKGRLDRALAGYIDCYRVSNDPRLDDLVSASLLAMINDAATVSISLADFNDLKQARLCKLIMPIAEALWARESYQTANELNQACGREYEEPIFPAATSGQLEIALLLPFSGELQSFGEEISHGAIIAADQYRARSGLDLKLVPYDTKGDPIDAARIVKELVNTGTDAVVGPLTSQEASVTSAVLNCDALPIIAPAATQAGLTLLSESAFQMSPNIELQGVQAAEYAIINRQADSAAIITPTSADHLRMARAFADRFEELGGTLVAIEYYRPRDNDFGPYVRDLKASLLGTTSDSTYFIGPEGDTLDIEAVAVNIDCLYLPGVASQLRLLLPQLNFYSVNGFYLGSDGWGDDAVYRLGDYVTKQAVFTSPFLEQERSQAYVQFAAEYDRRYGSQPHRLASLGYDAVRLVTTAVESGAANRQEMITHLSRIRDFQGAAAPVTFGEHRENIELPMYRLENGRPVYLGEASHGLETGGE